MGRGRGWEGEGRGRGGEGEERGKGEEEGEETNGDLNTHIKATIVKHRNVYQGLIELL